jgi:hypothetical protein
LCSFANDAKCGPGGRSFGDLGGANAGQCVNVQPLPDAGIPDSRPLDAGPACYGSAPYTVCFASKPTGNLEVTVSTTFDTATGTGTGTQLTCATTMSGGAGYCVVAANTITINSLLRAVGSKPLVLVAADSINVPASIDVSSRRNPTPPVDSIGAGADAPGCNAGTLPNTGGGASGGGAGGSFVGAGGNGGNGGGGNGGAKGSAPGFGTVLRGGCPGQDGAGGGHGARGHGGGAVFLIAGKGITVGGTINAGGEGGAGGNGANDGGGGGGAGGLIGFDAMTIMVTGTLIANGGGGGEGGSSGGTNGTNGGDASSTTAAPGGANASMSGGDGGAGSAGVAGGSGATPLDATGGGGGGGGGAGLIKGPPSSLGPSVSPAATP